MRDPRGQVDASWQALLAAIDGIPDARLQEPGAVGAWSVKDVLAHVAYWDARSQDDLERIAAGRATPEGETDWQADNDRVAAERANWPLVDVRRDLEETHQRVLSILDRLPNIDPEHVRGDWEHYDEHAAEIRAWRQRQGI